MGTPGRSLPQIIAHRGNAVDYPENTLLAIRSALQSGVRYVEFDIQLSTDGVPVLIHDADLQRTTGVEGCVLDMPYRQISQIQVKGSGRCDGALPQTRIAGLSQVADLLAGCLGVTAIIEIKRESAQRFGASNVVNRVLKASDAIADRRVVISFDIPTLEKARCRVPVGWVLHDYNARVRRQAQALDPAYLFCNHEKISHQQPLWPGTWKWVLYEITDPQLAPSLAQRGVDFIETMAVARFMSHRLYRQETDG